jgi:hypothetical protein
VRERERERMKRVCIIGAGPSGLSVLHAFNKIPQEQREQIELVCFEKAEAVGGQWRFCLLTGTDELGEIVPSAMYNNLWSNSPKEAIEYTDYTFKEHFKMRTCSYPPRAALLDYITGRAEKYDAEELNRIHFKTPVRDVIWQPDSETFSVKVHDLNTETSRTETFDYLVNCTGHYSMPNFPEPVVRGACACACACVYLCSRVVVCVFASYIINQSHDCSARTAGPRLILRPHHAQQGIQTCFRLQRAQRACCGFFIQCGRHHLTALEVWHWSGDDRYVCVCVLYQYQQ